MYCGCEHQREHWAPPGGGGHKAECKELAAVGWAADLAAAAAGFSAIQEAVAIKKLWRGRAGLIAQDLGGAARWFRCAVAPRARPTAADAKAQTSASSNLGVMLSQGQVPGVPRDKARQEALALWHSAADSRHAALCYNLANHQRREGDLDRAKALYRVAAEEGLDHAQYALAEVLSPLEGAMAANRDIQHPAFDAQWHESLLWWRKAAEQGHLKTMYRLGIAYSCAMGVDYDLAAGRTWLTRAAGLAMPRAHCRGARVTAAAGGKRGCSRAGGEERGSVTAKTTRPYCGGLGFSLQCGALFASLRRVSNRMPGAARLCAPTRP